MRWAMLVLWKKRSYWSTYCCRAIQIAPRQKSTSQQMKARVRERGFTPAIMPCG
jgi:hypothetical protein